MAFRPLFATLALGAWAGADTAGFHYAIDPSWQLRAPHGAGSYSAVAVSGSEVYVAQRNANCEYPILVFSKDGAFLRGFGRPHVQAVNGSFGDHGLAVQRADAAAGRQDILWVLDFFNSTVSSYSLDGQLLGQAGGGGGSSEVDKFGAVADVAFRGGSAFFADGDGGCNNRVERWAVTSGRPEKVEWVVPSGPSAASEFDNPHSICLHEPSDTLLVADRGHARIALLDPVNGSVRSSLRCDALKLGPLGKPFGVRTFSNRNADLLFVAVANDPQDGKNQFVHIVDITDMGRTGACKEVLQTIALSADFCHTPHLMAVDQAGDLYIACVAEPGSNLIRLRPHQGHNTVVV